MFRRTRRPTLLRRVPAPIVQSRASDELYWWTNPATPGTSLEMGKRMLYGTAVWFAATVLVVAILASI